MRRRLSRYVKLSGGVGHRLSRLPNGHLRDRLKTPYRDGSTHVVFESLDFMVHLLCATPSGRPAAVRIVNPADLSSPGWCPPPRANLMRDHSVGRRSQEIGGSDTA